MTYSPNETGHPELPATRARQGRWGRHLMWVLIVGTALAALAMIAAWAWRADTYVASEPSHAEQQKAAQSFDTPAPPPATPSQPPVSQ
jgi:hypothetical protein